MTLVTALCSSSLLPVQVENVFLFLHRCLHLHTFHPHCSVSIFQSSHSSFPAGIFCLSLISTCLLYTSLRKRNEQVLARKSCAYVISEDKLDRFDSWFEDFDEEEQVLLEQIESGALE